MNTIEIRKYRKEDINDFYEAVIESRKELSKWFPWCNEYYAIEKSIEWINDIVPKIWSSKTGCEFIIIDINQKKVVGACCLEKLNLDLKEANLAYWIRTHETKKGIATKACNFLLKFGFQTLNLDVINLILSVENTASGKVAEKLPYKEKEIVKYGFQIRNKISDALVYKITRDSAGFGT